MDLTIDSGLAAILGASVGAFAGLLGAAINNRHQRKLARLEDQRRIRDAKRERIRRPLRQLVHATWTMNQVMIDQDGLRGEQTEEERDIELLERWRSAMRAANEALLDLTMEQDADHLGTSFRDLCATFTRFQQQRKRAKESDAQWPTDLWNDVNAQVSNFERLVREAAAKAEQPL